jgi:hypothetical protein
MGRSKIRQGDAGIEGCGDNETFKNAEYRTIPEDSRRGAKGIAHGAWRKTQSKTVAPD